MHWFKLNTNTFHNSKVTEMRLEFGAEGYGFYVFLLEQIASTVSVDDTSFRLDMSVRVMSHNTGIDADRIRQMLERFAQIGLLEKQGGRFYCPDLLNGLDQSMTSNPRLRKLITQARTEREKRLKNLPDGPLDPDELPAEEPEKHDTKPAKKPAALHLEALESDRHDDHHDLHHDLHHDRHHDDHHDGHHARREEKRREEILCRVAPDGVLDLEFERDDDPVPGEIEIQRSRSPEAQLLDYLNRSGSRQFKPTDSNLKYIRARLREGFSYADCCHVIDFKVGQWQGTKMDRYLRPATLFNATKFDAYLQESLRPEFESDPDDHDYRDPRTGERRQTLEDLLWV